MSHSKLSDHKLKREIYSTFNEFMTPLNSNESWCLGRLPEYIWIGLLINKYGRKKGWK